MNRNTHPGLAISLCTALAAASLVHADEPHVVPGGAVDVSVVNGNALHGASGAIAVNLSAGDANVQSNAAAVAVSPADGAANAQVLIHQATDARQANAPRAAISFIGDGAFRDVNGVLSVNQASGVGNAQSNGVAIAVGGRVVAQSLSENLLAGTAAGTPVRPAGPATAARAAAIGETAFDGARGLVQVNQVAGSGNATANNFSLSVELGAKP